MMKRLLLPLHAYVQRLHRWLCGEQRRIVLGYAQPRRAVQPCGMSWLFGLFRKRRHPVLITEPWMTGMVAYGRGRSRMAERFGVPRTCGAVVQTAPVVTDPYEDLRDGIAWRTGVALTPMQLQHLLAPHPHLHTDLSIYGADTVLYAEVIDLLTCQLGVGPVPTYGDIRAGRVDANAYWGTFTQQARASGYVCTSEGGATDE